MVCLQASGGGLTEEAGATQKQGLHQKVSSPQQPFTFFFFYIVEGLPRLTYPFSPPVCLQRLMSVPCFLGAMSPFEGNDVRGGTFHRTWPPETRFTSGNIQNKKVLDKNSFPRRGGREVTNFIDPLNVFSLYSPINKARG